MTMAFTPLLQRPWVTKSRTLAWKLKTAIVWLAIMAAIWMGAFFYLMSLKPSAPSAGREIGSTLGAAAAVILLLRWGVIVSRPRSRGIGGSRRHPPPPAKTARGHA